MSSLPESMAPPPVERANGLATYLKVFYAPSEAFATLARVPTWGWAAVIGIILTIVSTLIMQPATIHYTHIAQEQSLSQMSADRAAAAREAMSHVPQWIYSVGGVVVAFFIPWGVWLIGALIYLVGAALSGGDARFRNAWIVAVNAYGIAAVSSIVNAVIVMLRGVENINSAADLYGLPSLAMLVHGSPKLAALLYGFNVFNLWLYYVIFIALGQVMKMSRTAAIVTVAILAVIGACLGAAFAK